MSVRRSMKSARSPNAFPHWSRLMGVCLLVVFSFAAAADGAGAPTVAQGADERRQDITGYVVDVETGEVFPYANVMVKGTRIGAVTNTDGHFVLVNVPAKPCTVLVSFIGYMDEEVIVDNTTRQVKPLRIAMHPRVFEQEGITVYGERYELWKAADEVGQISFSARDISVLPSFGEVDIFRSLQLLPGISGVGDGSSGLYIRGGTPDQNLVLLDGMTVYHVDHFFGIFSAFNTDAIKDIQVFKGGYPARYGGRLSSVVELTGKNGDINDSHFGFSANLLSVNAVAELPLFGKGSWLVSARRSYTDVIQSGLYNDLFGLATGGEDASGSPSGQGFNEFRGGRFFQQESVPAFYFYDINSKVTFTPSPKDVVALSFYNGKDKLSDSQQTSGLGFRSFGDGGTDISGSRQSDEITDWGNLGGSVRWSRQWNSRFYTNLLVAHSTYESSHTTSRSFTAEGTLDTIAARAFGSSELDEDNTVSDGTFRFDTRWHATSSHELRFGAWVSQLETKYAATMNDTLQWVNRSGTSLLSALYVEDKWQLAKRWELTFGVRGAHYDRTSRLYYEPRASLRFSLTDHLALNGAWGRYHQYVNRVTNEDVLEGSRDFWLIADDELEPGAAEHTILGVSYEDERHLVSVEAYRKDMDNLMEYTRRVWRGPEEPENPFFLGTGVARGVEFLVQRKTGAVTGWVSYTLGDVEYTFPELNDGSSFRADHDRTHEVKTVGIYKTGSWTLSGTWVFATGKPYTAPESQYFLTLLDGEQQSYTHVGEKNASRLPNYHRLDMSVSLNLVDFDLPRWDVGISVLNLYNHRNVSYRKFDLQVSPMIVTDVLDLGMTPTLFVKANF